ncbi:MAG TPA: hypothetical protein ENL00_02795, partial [Nitratifractor sp.]|nr:hypothetical protein [Nitratifractor sp.]
AGAFNAFAAGIGRSEVASIWATGHLWLRVPESFEIIVNGKMPKGVYAKDLALHIIGDIRADGANYMSVEFRGETISDMTMAMIICKRVDVKSSSSVKSMSYSSVAILCASFSGFSNTSDTSPIDVTRVESILLLKGNFLAMSIFLGLLSIFFSS